MIAAVLVPLLVLVAVVLLERYEARIAPRETPRTGTDGVSTGAGSPRHLSLVRDGGTTTAPARADDLSRAS